MKPIKKISDPDGQNYEFEMEERIKLRQAKVAAAQAFRLIDLANYFDILGNEIGDKGLSDYAKDIDNIIRRTIENDS